MSKAKSAEQQIKEAKAQLQHERVVDTLKRAGVPEKAILTEVQFQKGSIYEDRKWAADYGIDGTLIVIEIEGGVYIRGRHTRGAGYTNDCEKYTAASTLGYILLHFITQDIGTQYMVDAVKLAYKYHNKQRQLREWQKKRAAK